METALKVLFQHSHTANEKTMRKPSIVRFGMQVWGITTTHPVHPQVKISSQTRINVPCVSSHSCLSRSNIHLHSAQKCPARNEIVRRSRVYHSLFHLYVLFPSIYPLTQITFCVCTLWRLEFNWRCDNSAIFFFSSWGCYIMPIWSQGSFE
jgi:hypothetical protein